MVKNILQTQKLTIFELVKYFNYNTSLLVLEYNNLICNKKNWIKSILKIMIKLKL
jgi:sulfur carrier protein ThiS